ncbi:aldose 1-epimerase [Jejuia spongiicola]|uniref:Aldose 1-epimerase n=1 Tax=Jejuia spongiicola TaxID=2942207 RepID=A0ABT0QEE4_9FLAO|nr:aldose 1-epimerase [Jejuia spongiicola]MCL6294833.1 aldose 1-epimerase [Jejuia spongiicola]
MYKIEKSQEGRLDYLELINYKGDSKAKISLNEGGRLKELQFDGISVIKDRPNIKYENTHASSILFPFANRVKDGIYSFEDETHQLFCNEKGRNNAIHGVVFDKKFTLIKETTTSNFVEVTLSYQEEKKSKGFPFFYKISLIYTLSENSISLSVKIENTDTQSFPFTVGWHPYFISENLYDSILDFESNQKIEFDKNLITTGVYKNHLESPFKIRDVQLDDCYILKGNRVEFKTPSYSIEINTNKEENYLQLYNPVNTQVVAIEPMTGISDSFNNKIGLQVLKPNEEYKIEWNINFNKAINNNTN